LRARFVCQQTAVCTTCAFSVTRYTHAALETTAPTLRTRPQQFKKQEEHKHTNTQWRIRRKAPTSRRPSPSSTSAAPGAYNSTASATCSEHAVRTQHWRRLGILRARRAETVSTAIPLSNRARYALWQQTSTSRGLHVPRVAVICANVPGTLQSTSTPSPKSSTAPAASAIPASPKSTAAVSRSSTRTSQVSSAWVSSGIF